MQTWRSLLVGCAISVLVVGCATPPPPPPASSTNPPSPSTPGLLSPSQTPSLGAVEHRIGVRVVKRAGELFDRTTGKRFVPRGSNYTRLGTYHDTLDPGTYDAARLEAAFGQMEADGYNVVRVFHDHRVGGLADSSGGLNPAYLDNTVDLLRRAKAHGLFVIFTQDWPPEGDAYSFASDPGIGGINGQYLAAGGVASSGRFFADFARGLIERAAPIDAILAYELRNELYFSATDAPFSLRSGKVTAANGKTYDVASKSGRAALLEDGLVFWVDRVREAILGVDPTALVTVGFFEPQAPNPARPGDTRLIETKAAILRSTLDFIDLHTYPGGMLSLAEYAENFKLPRVTAKPVIMGEFGGFRSAFPTPADAARGLVLWQIESCTLGFDGWLLWTWDTDEQGELWNGLSGDGSIARLLAPTVRPDPCTTGVPDLSLELATHARIRASRTLAGTTSAAVIDGKADTIWSAGDYSSQWIQLDLRAIHTVQEIRLLVSQYPAGRTTNMVSVRGATGAWRRIATLRGVTRDGDWLIVRPAGGALRGVLYVRVETTASPSWVAWREISVLGK